MNIVGGVLSSNVNELHLVAEQLKQEKNQMLSNIKLKVQSGEIYLAEASKLTHDKYLFHTLIDISICKCVSKVSS